MIKKQQLTIDHWQLTKNMKYSLLSQFKGALLGAILGEIICQELSIVEGGKRKRENLISSQQKSFQEIGQNSSINRALSGEIAIISARSLIKYEGLELEDWQWLWERWQRKKLRETPNNGAVSAGPSELENSKWEEARAWEIVVASVPVAMLDREPETKLREKLNQIVEVCQGNLDVKLNNLAVGYAIALGLKQKLDPETAIPKTISYLQEEGPLVELLKEVQSLLEKRADLETAITKLSEKAKAMQETLSGPTPSLMSLPLAFYCFLSSPENWELAVLRAARTGRGSQICAIVGTLSGVYNSIAGIPVAWRRSLDARPLKIQAMGEAATGEAEIIKLATSLWALWCGVYNPEITDKIEVVPAVAPSNVIRPR